ncbi:MULTISPECIES: P27 family phage terminase small subunit [unclassified Sedimentibacter]|uniref:P27 family phage terminase small subunit n=1 Tax=unclassified Sedimentibacter TaxID=2649220 RepID=UPI0027E1D852|nr:P27 family phage terminase small subunit [Sedimentibacter sp. MB35-C1]WMJ78472.1 P27 family phage terminase small subunit [Sedimentibacter sp. MB35-C1]
MAGKATTYEGIRKKTIRDMKKLGVYKPEYEPIIDIYSELREQYFILTEKFKDSGYDFEVETMQGGTKKAPIVATLESLRKDIITYTDRLCLNPKAVDTVKIQVPKKSALAEALSKL